MMRNLAFTFGLFAVLTVQGQDSLSSRVLEEVVVSGARMEQSVSQIPRQVAVISRTEIEQSAFHSVGDLLAKQPGLYLVGANQAPGSNQSLFMRGAGSNQVVVMIDGVRLTDPSTPNNAVDLSELSLAEVERIEIVRGGHSTLYGSAAIGGVVNIITRKNSATGLHGQLSAQAGQLGPAGSSFHQMADAEYRSSQGWFVRGSLWNQNARGFNATVDTVTNRFKPADADDFRKTDGRLSIGYQRNGFDVAIAYKSTKQRVDTDAGAFADDDNSFLTFHRNWWQVNANVNVSDRSTISCFGAYSSSVRQNENDSSQVAPGVFDGSFSRGRYDGKLLTQEVQFTHTRDRLSVVSGAGLFYEQMNFDTYFFSSQFGGFEFTTNYDSLRQESFTSYAFARANWSWSPRLTLQGGARGNYHSLFGFFTTGDLGVVYALRPQTALFVSGSMGFNTPSLSQLFDPARGFGAITARGNSALSPERSASIEVGLRYTGRGGTRGAVSFFHNTTRQSIEYVYLWDRATPVEQLTFLDYQGDTYLNIARQRHMGMEASGTLYLRKNFWLDGHVTWMTNRLEAQPRDLPADLGTSSHVQLFANGRFLDAEVTDNALPRRPSVMTRARANLQLKKWLLQVAYRYDGTRLDAAYDPSFGPFGALGRVPVGAYQLVDATVLFNLSPRVSLNFTAENLFNLDYQEIAGFATRGRSAYLKIVARW